MGCVFGREVSSSGSPRSEVVVGEEREKERQRDLAVQSGRREKVRVQNDGDESEEKKDVSAKQRGERRRSRPNTRLSNPPKCANGEQVAAGWPAWLSDVAGEAINGWTPRRVDTFEKLDKASFC